MALREQRRRRADPVQDRSKLARSLNDGRSDNCGGNGSRAARRRRLMRDSVMGGHFSRAGLAEAAGSLKTAAAQTLPAGSALPPFSSCEQRGEDVVKAAETACALRSGGYSSDGLLSARSRRPHPPAPRRRRGTRQCFFDARRWRHFGEPQRLGSQRVSSADARPPWPSRFSEVVDELHALSPLASQTASGSASCDTTEIVVDRRSPANPRHIEIDGPRQAIHLMEATLQAMGGHT